MEKEVKQAILSGLKDENPNIRRGAATAAGEEGIRSAGPLLASLLKDPIWQVRQAAAISLGKLREEKASGFLMKMIGATEETLRVRAVKILGQKAKSPAEVREAVKQLWGTDFKEKEVHLPVLRGAAWALVQIKRNWIVEPLVKIVENGNTSQTIAALSGFAVMGVKDVTEIIVRCLDHEQWQVRQAAAIALGKVGAVEASEHVVKLYDDPRWEVRLEVVIALNNLKSEDAKSVFMKAIKDERPKVRRAAAIALGNTRDISVVDVLVDVLKDKNWMVRKAALSALGNLKARDVKEEILGCLLDDDEEVRQEAALAYGRCVPNKV